jgi:hypothetical protein
MADATYRKEVLVHLKVKKKIRLLIYLNRKSIPIQTPPPVILIY